MKLLDNFSPSFEMNVHDYIPNESIELRGRNNWNSLLVYHLLIMLTTIIITYFAINSRWFEQFMLFRLVIIGSLIGIGNFVYFTFKTARNSTYLKEEIRFNKEGILLNPNLGGKQSQFIKREGLKNLNLIFDGNRFKFILYSLNRPYFEFSIAEKEKIKPNTFLENLIKMYDLEIEEGATFQYRTILTLKKKLTQKDKFPLIKNVGASKTPKKKKTSRTNSKKKYKPKGFYYYQLKDELIFEQHLGKEVMALPRKSGLNKAQKIIWYRNIFFLKKVIKFSEIRKYDFDIERRSIKSRKYIEGVFFITKLDGKRVKYFTIERELDKEQELVELEVLKDLEFLRRLIKQEILETRY